MTIYFSTNPNGLAIIQAYAAQLDIKKQILKNRYNLYEFKSFTGICPSSLSDTTSVLDVEIGVLFEKMRANIKKIVVIGEQSGLVRDFCAACGIEIQVITCSELMNLRECKKCAKQIFVDLETARLSQKYEFLKGFVESMYV
ncbi:hypothetical protein SS50377_23095 [Spironucleus salmonicida]|uniref:Uncharacterized protein n=1 Tax=Spironucleus salmonicida TaxID=348837 RepID=V6LDI8_9EUKA|nr:hypothetical protein SS50377_23095 [Spironucleus salmonicida]|eukprot:EST41731.1 Hypothetical protein SS50377_18817 [Spironucleus salmonicida]